MMNKGVAALQGKPLTEAVSVLGFPSSKMEMAGKEVYTWNYGATGFQSVPMTSNTFGSIGGTPYYGTTATNALMPTPLTARVQIMVDKKDIIVASFWEGQNGALIGPANALGKYAKEQKKRSDLSHP